MITNTINFGNETFTLEWHDSVNFSDIYPVTQVYGVCFHKGEILVIGSDGSWQLPGGTPEKDESFEDTLKREAEEEANIEIEKIAPLGYQKVKNIKTGEIFYQLRYGSVITKIKNQKMDPATNKIYKRKLIQAEEFSKYCKWGKIGEAIIQRALVYYKSLNNSNPHRTS